jgi:N-acetylneuraminic acid mutarotase
MYVFGGMMAMSETLDELWEFESSSKTWTELVVPGAPSRAGHSAVAMDNKVVFGSGPSINIK